MTSDQGLIDHAVREQIIGMGLSGLFHLVPNAFQIISVTIRPGPFLIKLPPSLKPSERAKMEPLASIFA